ncbi:MAG: hypothetical protein IJL91_05755 [Bacteroidales bacterium]|nr:hypothetical protein [Bacteroidales bacterium]
MTEEISWGDGSGDKIYLTFGASEGTQTISVSSDPNAGTSERSKNVVFTTAAGGVSKTLTVKQDGYQPTEHTVRLIPSNYAVSSTSYLSVSNASNMYHNTDNTTYATITNTNSSTSSRYLYLRGFNFSDIPSGATVTSFTVKIKGYERSLSTSTSYAPRLANGTSALSNTTASTNFGTSTKTITIPTGALTWTQMKNYGSNFTIMVYVRRNSRNTTGYFYCYGAEIEVKYTL